MKGAIIGDIVGSRFESFNIKSKQFSLFNEMCSLYDDFENCVFCHHLTRKTVQRVAEIYGRHGKAEKAALIRSKNETA